MERGDIPSILLYGPPGTGKTTAALAFVRQFLGTFPSPNAIMLNASDDRGIGVIRDTVANFLKTRAFLDKLKIVLLDEADSMTDSAQFALRRMMELYSKTCRFIFLCNHENRIIPALRSRTISLRFGPLKNGEVLSLINKVCKAEDLKLE